MLVNALTRTKKKKKSEHALGQNVTRLPVLLHTITMHFGDPLNNMDKLY